MDFSHTREERIMAWLRIAVWAILILFFVVATIALGHLG